MSKSKKILLVTFIIIACLIIACSLTVYFMVKDSKLNSDKLMKNHGNIEVFDTNYSKLEPNLEYYVEYQNISPKLIDAFVTLEDKRFYNHKGLDYKRILGAMAKNIATFSYKEGASTITQQLIKNTHLTNEKTIKRKLVEAKLAIELEKNYSKQQILEMYLNAIYFGNGIYGIENACRTIYNCSSKDVTLEQAATLAGIVKNPKKYSPINNLQNAEERRNVVLKVMLDNSAISNKEYENAKAKPIQINYKPNKSNYCAQYYQNVIYEASDILGVSDKEVMYGNYKIYTYMDSDLQKSTFQKVNNDGYNPYDCQQSVVVLDNKTYGLVAYHSNISQPLRLIKRQFGSVLKPFSVYAPCFENNYYPAQKILDDYINIDGYAPGNYDKNFHGMVTIREALVKSYNVPAVKILNEIGLGSSISLLKNLGFNINENQENLSIALGSLSGSPLDIVGAYAMLANNGVYYSPQFISDIYDNNGKLIYSNKVKGAQVISSESAYMLNDILTDCAKYGTASKLQYVPYAVAGKTGTVGDKNGNITDVWSCGYSTDYTVLSWQGVKKQELPLNYGGGGMPTLIVKDIMINLPSAKEFDCPPTIKRVPIDKQQLDINNKIVYKSDSNYYELFTNLNMPEIKTQVAVLQNNGDVYINASIGTTVKIYKIGVFGGERLIFDGVVESENMLINDLLENSIFSNRYKIVVGDIDYYIAN